VKDGKAVVIAAPRNTGKTTTIAHLAYRGWAFVTDETVRLCPDRQEVSGSAKPLSIKPGGEPLVRHLEAWMMPQDGRQDSTAFKFVPMGASGAAITASGRPHLFVLLRRRSNPDAVGPPEFRRLHPADAVVALMQQTLDAERFGSAALQLARSASSAHCFDVIAGTPEATVHLVERLHDEGPAEPMDVTLLPVSHRFVSTAESVQIGDRVVVHEHSSGRVFAMDPKASQIWKYLGGWDTESAMDVEGPVIEQFVAQLQALGVLAPAA
jgi:hypothetical protein